MSAAVNDRPHTVFSVRPHLPLTGDSHPLRREFARWLMAGNSITLAVAILACAVVYFWPHAAPETTYEIPRGPGIDIQPPPIDQTPGPPGIAPEAPPDLKGIFVPADSVDVIRTLPEKGQSVGTDLRGNPGDGRGDYDDPMPGDKLDIPKPPPSPDEYIPFDNAPELISCDPPVYPHMVREAGIDGTVIIRVLIGLNGRVKDAYVVSGPEALHSAALASARTALFKPAEANGHAVEVWVAMPISFQLRSRY